MVAIAEGNILKADAEALVNTVNCDGFMGKGIALQFKKAFPENYKEYERACRAGEVVPGRMFVFETGAMVNPKYIINFPTKRHWRNKSRIEDIRDGLRSLAEEVKARGIRSIAVPPLGCGLGGLDWRVVRPMIEETFETMPGVELILFEPHGAPAAASMPVSATRPEMTSARALIIMLMKRYSRHAYRLSLLEVQKLAYFLQEAGEPLKLRFEEQVYGPYAHNLNHLLDAMDGHFMRGCGDTHAPDVQIETLPGAVKEAESFLSAAADSRTRLEKVSELIEGFETPYGMELLSTVHWLANHRQPPVLSSADAAYKLREWNTRKRKLFKDNHHIDMAWNRLSEEGWIQ